MNAEQKAARIKAFLDDEVIQEVFASAEQKCFDTFRSSQDVDGARGAWEIARAIQSLKHEFEILLQDGTRAEIERKATERAEARAQELAQRRTQRPR